MGLSGSCHQGIGCRYPIGVVQPRRLLPPWKAHHSLPRQNALIFLSLLFWKKTRKTHPKKQGFLLYAEPLKSLGKKGKTLKKTKQIPCNEKKARKSKKARKGRSGWSFWPLWAILVQYTFQQCCGDSSTTVYSPLGLGLKNPLDKTAHLSTWWKSRLALTWVHRGCSDTLANANANSEAHHIITIGDKIIAYLIFIPDELF